MVALSGIRANGERWMHDVHARMLRYSRSKLMVFAFLI